MNTANMRTPPRFLTDDEVVRLPGRSGDCEFRVRIWRGREATPIVLATRHEDHTGKFVAPSVERIKLANYVHSAVLGYPEYGMLYFDCNPYMNPDPLKGEIVWRLTQVFFEFFGTKERIRLIAPLEKKTTWAFLETILGQKVDH